MFQQGVKHGWTIMNVSLLLICWIHYNLHFQTTRAEHQFVFKQKNQSNEEENKNFKSFKRVSDFLFDPLGLFS